MGRDHKTAAHMVRRAIIMAAGTGSRLYPVTRSIPKPLVRVQGIPMIESVVRALRKNSITEIYVVTGYLGEQFAYLEQAYPGLKLLKNPYYKMCNNISSLYVARMYLEDVMILDGDQMIHNPDILFREFDRSGYHAVYTETGTDEWLLRTENGIVTGCSRNGGNKGWQLYSISRWTKEDGQRLAGHLELEFEQYKNRQIYWDDVALFCYPSSYRLRIFETAPGDVVEIDGLMELAEADPAYSGYLQEGYGNGQYQK